MHTEAVAQTAFTFTLEGEVRLNILCVISNSINDGLNMPSIQYEEDTKHESTACTYVVDVYPCRCGLELPVADNHLHRSIASLDYNSG